MATNKRPKDFVCMHPGCEAVSPRADKIEERIERARAAGWSECPGYPEFAFGVGLCPAHTPPTKETP